jgi:predicted dehydrogenase
MENNKKSGITRRDFLATGAVATAAISGFPFVYTTRAQQRVKPIRIAVDGCGGRGTGAVQNAIDAAPDVHLIAMADPFMDRIESSYKNLTNPPRRGAQQGAQRGGAPPAPPRPPGQGIEVTKDHMFDGLDGYKKLLELDIDYVILTEPPGFRARALLAAIEAGKNVFAEKPLAVDVAGYRMVLEAGKLAQKKGLSICVGYDKRHTLRCVELIKRIHDGQIGEILSGRSYYNTGFLWHRGDERPKWTEMEYQCRNWYYFCWLSGDQIGEQTTHNIDAQNWVNNGPPVRAIGDGGRICRTDPKWGNIWDNMTIDYEYPNEVHWMTMMRQWDKVDGAGGDFVVGTKGRANLATGEITGEKPWKYVGESPQAKVYEHKELIDSIRNGKPMNMAAESADSALTSVLGRESCYTGKTLTWDNMLKSELDLFPKKCEFGPAPDHDMPIPGRFNPVTRKNL